MASAMLWLILRRHCQRHSTASSGSQGAGQVAALANATQGSARWEDAALVPVLDYLREAKYTQVPSHVRSVA